MKKLSKDKRLDLLFEWFAKTEESEKLRKDVLSSMEKSKDVSLNQEGASSTNTEK